MVFRRLIMLSGLILPLGGCAWAVREATDPSMRGPVPNPVAESPHVANSPAAPAAGNRTAAARGPNAVLLASASAAARPAQDRAPISAAPAEVPAAAAADAYADRSQKGVPLKDDLVQTVSWTRSQPGDGSRIDMPNQLKLEISPRLPGAEAPPIALAGDRAAVERQLELLYPDLPALPDEPKPQPGPGGKPYTLADLQRLAAANSPMLRQAASDVEAARGNLVQAMTYPNPVAGYIADTSATNNTSGVQAGFVDQPIITGGKMKLGVAATQKSLDNAVLALKRARMDLATSVRNAYFTLLVDVETLAVTQALAQFSDGIYRLQVGLQKGTQAAPYEPTALRAQTYLNRLAYRQAIQSYVMDWKALVATLGLPQLPLSEVSGQVHRFIPYYDYDQVRDYVLQHHTDVLTARNGIKVAQYNLKLAQVTGVCPNLDVYMALEKDFVNPPHGTYQALALGLPLPIWNQNKGNIIAAQAALIRAAKETHRVEVTLTNNLALAYENYRNNLYAMESYRRHVLPNLVRYYRGIYARRQVDRNSSFGDLVFAQQNLSTNVQAYLNLLQSLWMSVVSVADFLQTDDLYQMGTRHDLPGLPDVRLLRLSPSIPGDEKAAASPVTAAGPGRAATRVSTSMPQEAAADGPAPLRAQAPRS
jgi:cobalt-zinc-cadmium efflux system outer membrane protein